MTTLMTSILRDDNWDKQTIYKQLSNFFVL